MFSVVAVLFTVKVERVFNEEVVETLEVLNSGNKAIIITLLQVGDAIAKIDLPLRQQLVIAKRLHEVGKFHGVPFLEIDEVPSLN